MRGLDLFCGAGGAARGYDLAGHQIVLGVDVVRQPRYPYPFLLSDALALLERLIAGKSVGISRPHVLTDFGFIHASPPCQRWSAVSHTGGKSKDDYPDFIGPLRPLLMETGLPYVIENVPRAPLESPVMICGSMFDPPLDVQRHRLFEANWSLEPPMWPCRHKLWGPRWFPGNRSDRRKDERAAASVVSVIGNDVRKLPDGTPGLDVWKRAMEIDWMNREELAEAIPPRYTEHIGRELTRVFEP